MIMLPQMIGKRPTTENLISVFLTLLKDDVSDVRI